MGFFDFLWQTKSVKSEEKELRWIILEYYRFTLLLKCLKETKPSNVHEQVGKALRILRKEERVERRLARHFPKMEKELKEDLEKLNNIHSEKIKAAVPLINKLHEDLHKAEIFNTDLEKKASRGGEVEKLLKSAEKDTTKINELIQQVEEVLKEIQGFDTVIKKIKSETASFDKDIEEDIKADVIATNLKTALMKRQEEIIKLIEAFKPIFRTGNIQERNRIISGIKTGLKGMKLLGVGGNGIVLKIKLLGKDYALKIATDLDNEVFNLTYAQGIKGVPIFYFKTVINNFDVLLLEFIPGMLIYEYVKAKSLPKDFFDKIDNFVKQLHARGMAHRDMQQENVIVIGGYPMIMDFGLSKVRATDAEMRFDLIFVQGMKLQFLRYTKGYKHNVKALNAEMKKILNGLDKRLKTETSRENKQTIEMIFREAKKHGLM